MLSPFFRSVLLLSLLLISCLAAQPAMAGDGCLYAIDIGDDFHQTRLYDINPLTGHASNPRLTGMGSAIGLALGSDGFLYAVTASASTQPKHLYRIDPVSGVATDVGPLGISAGLSEGDIAFHPNGTLYGFSNQNTAFTVDLNTGAATPLPNMGLGSADYSSLSFHDNGTLYALDNRQPPGQYPTRWRTLLPNSGTVATSHNLPYTLGPLGGMDFDGASGEFLMIETAFPGSNFSTTNSLYRLDAQGNRTLIGPLGVNSAFSGLAACNTARQPDLIVSQVDFNAECDVDFKISNIGGGDVYGSFSFQASPLAVPAWGPGPQTAGSAGINGLAAGQSITHTWSSVEVYGPQLNVHVDHQGQINESDDNNNQSSFAAPESCIFEPKSCVRPPADMTGWYPFDETGGVLASDIRGLHYGVKANGPVPTGGKVAGGLEFDGVDDYVWVPHTNDYNFDGPGSTGAFTIDAWILPHSGDTGTIVSKRADGVVPTQSRGYGFIVQADGIGFFIFTDSPGPPAHYVSESNVLQIGQWNHVAVTIDRATLPSIFLYVNGVEVTNSNGYTNILTDNFEPLYIGASRHTDTGEMINHFDGIIDEVEIFDRALSANELHTLYAAQSYGKCKRPCPALRSLSEGRVEGKMSAAAVANVLYRVRDERLDTSANGRYFTNLFQHHRLRMAYLMLRSSDLRRAAEAVLHAYAPGLELQLRGLGGKEVINARMVQQVVDFANLLIETDLLYDGGDLATAVESEVRRIEWQALPGKDFDQLWHFVETLRSSD